MVGEASSLVARAVSRLCDPRDRVAATAVALLLCAGEAVLCALIIWRVPYTEIDWEARHDAARFAGLRRE
jgi:hypothetical protein